MKEKFIYIYTHISFLDMYLHTHTDKGKTEKKDIEVNDKHNNYNIHSNECLKETRNWLSRLIFWWTVLSNFRQVNIIIYKV